MIIKKANSKPKYKIRTLKLIQLIEMIDKGVIALTETNWDKQAEFLTQLKDGYPIKNMFTFTKVNDKLVCVEGANQLSTLYYCLTPPKKVTLEYVIESGMCYDLAEDIIEPMNESPYSCTKIPLYKLPDTKSMWFVERRFRCLKLHTDAEIYLMVENYATVGTLFIDLPINITILL